MTTYTNYMPNPSIESILSIGTASSGGTGRWPIVTADATAGDTVLKYEPSATGNMLFLGHDDATSWFPISQGGTFYASLDIGNRGATPGVWDVYAEFLDGAKATVELIPLESGFTNPDTSLTRRSWSAVNPTHADTAYARLRIVNTTLGAMYIDRVLLSDQEYPEYFDGDHHLAEWNGTAHQSTSTLNDAAIGAVWVPDNTLVTDTIDGTATVTVVAGAATYTPGVWSGVDGIVSEGADVYVLPVADLHVDPEVGGVAIKFQPDTIDSTYRTALQIGRSGAAGQTVVIQINSANQVVVGFRRNSMSWAVYVLGTPSVGVPVTVYAVWNKGNIVARMDDNPEVVGTREWTDGDLWVTGSGGVKIGCAINSGGSAYESQLGGRIDAVASLRDQATDAEYVVLRDASTPWTLNMLQSDPNTAPTVDAGADATITAGDTLTRTVSFTDPDADTWSATADYGEGAGAEAVSVDQGAKTVALSHTYSTAGVYTVTVEVSDGTTTGQDTFAVTVNEVGGVIIPNNAYRAAILHAGGWI